MSQGDIYRVAVRGGLDSVEWVNTLYFKQLSASGDLGGLADAIDSTIYQPLAPMQPTGFKVLDITLSQLVVGGGEQLVSPRTTVGTAAANSGATTSCAVASFRTALAGRSHRGRNYVPLYDPLVIQGGGIGASNVTTIQNAYNAFLAIYGQGGTDTDYSWGVWSRKLGETLDANGKVTGYNPNAGFFLINKVKIDATARVQRRREGGVGT